MRNHSSLNSRDQCGYRGALFQRIVATRRSGQDQWSNNSTNVHGQHSQRFLNRPPIKSDCKSDGSGPPALLHKGGDESDDDSDDESDDDSDNKSDDKSDGESDGESDGKSNAKYNVEYNVESDDEPDGPPVLLARNGDESVSLFCVLYFFHQRDKYN
jgi:hypothetical protein